MADGYRFQQQSAGSYYYQQHTQPHLPRHQIIRNGTPPNNIRSVFNGNTPSPSRSPENRSPAQNLYGMFNSGHQQGQHGRVNGGPGGRGMPAMYNFQHQNSHQPQHMQHHANIQQDHNPHATNGAVLGHHTSYSSGVLSNSTPNFTPGNLQNGHSSTTRGGQAEEITEHWGVQLQLHKESEKAHTQMMDGAPNHYARIKATENRGITPAPAPPVSAPTESQDEENRDIGRMADQQNTVKRQDWHNIDLSGQGLRVLSAPIFNYVFLKELYVASNKLSYLPSTIGELRHLTLLDVSNNQLSQLPPELGMCVYLEQLLVFDNNIRSLPSELGSLFHLKMLGIEGNPLDPNSKNVIMNNGTKELILQLRESAPVPMPPQPRAILDITGDTPASPERFKVFSFNILNEGACTEKMYGYSSTEALSWKYRSQLVLQEIETQDADFVCLQEVDKQTYDDFFASELAKFHYKGVFFPRSRARTMAEKDQGKVDGCATFYKNKSWICLDKEVVEFNKVAIARQDAKNQHDVFNRIMPRDHIAVVTFFEHRFTGSRLIVVNTHLFWDPAYCDVKLIQTALLLGELSRLAERFANRPPEVNKPSYFLKEDMPDVDLSEMVPEPSKEYSSKTQIPLVICADQNSTAESSVFELFARGSVRPDHPELQGYKYGNFTKDGMDHPFSLKSAYTNLDKTPEKLPFTNYTPGFRGVIDHIWYSTNALENTSLLGRVDPEYMRTVPGFPNYHFPSDHLSLMAEFAIKGPKPKKALPEVDFGTSSRSNERRR